MRHCIFTIGLVIALATSTALKSSCTNLIPVTREEISISWGEEYMGNYPHAYFSIDMPTGNDAVSNSIKKWIATSFNVDPSYTDNAEQFVNAYINNVRKDVLADFAITKVYETNTMVSFEIEGNFGCCGCAHGTDYIYGMTFRKSDGKPMGKSIFKRGFDLNALCIERLKKHWNLPTDKDLSESLIPWKENIKHMAPKQVPWITIRGINLQYCQYEVGGLGEMPCLILPIRQDTSFLSAEMKELVRDSKWSRSWDFHRQFFY